MKRWLSTIFCIIPKPHRKIKPALRSSDSQEIGVPMVDPGPSTSSHTNGSERTELEAATHNSMETNFIVNNDFSGGLDSWYPNCCHAYVAPDESGFPNGVTAHTGDRYAVVIKRTQSWQGLEQSITEKVTLGTSYTFSAYVRVNETLGGPVEVRATLKLIYSDSNTNYLSVGSTSVSDDHWQKLDGSFSLTSMPNHIVLYLEGPPPGVDLFIDSIVVTFSGPKQLEKTKVCAEDGNIIHNPWFEDGLSHWSGKGCNIVLHGSSGDGRINPLSGKHFASASGRSQNWNGIQQDITFKVARKQLYELSAMVRISGASDSAEVRATLWVKASNGWEEYISIAKLQASNKEWIKLQGKFLVNVVPSKVVIYLEGPPPGTDILVDSFVVKRSKKLLSSSPQPDIEVFADNKVTARNLVQTNIISNHDFSKGLHSWSLNSCDGYVVSGESSLLKGVTALTGANFAVITNRTEAWQGLEQDITRKVAVGSVYDVRANVRVWGPRHEPFPVIATLKLEYPNSPPKYQFIGRASVSKEQWEKLDGSFSLTSMPSRVIFFLEGPPPGQDLLIDSVNVACAHSHFKQCANIIENSSLDHGLKNWSPLGSCKLSVCSGSPLMLPTVAKDSFGRAETLSGLYILTTNRTETWMGPSQIITDKLKLHVTYQIVAWVRVGSTQNGPQTINVTLGVDDQWNNGGKVLASDDRWYEVMGSFRIEKKPSKVVAYVQGPSPGVDIMISGLHIFPVDRKARFNHLKEKTDKVRKRDIVLKLPEKFSGNRTGVHVKIRQTKNSFPFGSCISRSNIENEEFVDFFLKNFNWAVFGNELKWYSTEPEQGKYNYKDADEMLDFCKKNRIETRGHCIFWEVEDAVQSWVRSLSHKDLMAAVQNRLHSLLTRYKGKFRHYDVNNEMLHGSFFQDRLGKDIRAYMFREAHKIDPSATLFVNDYNVEDGCDHKSSPEMYIDQVLSLQEQGAPVGGIGLQGHISHPVGEIICAALDKLEMLGLPIWFTELDVAASNEHVRADDLEVMLREAYAHPSVEGIVLWGFWELFMCRDHSHLVDAEGDVNEAGKRYIALKNEWLTNIDGQTDENGEFRFRGYHGTYSVEVTTPQNKSSHEFVVDKGDAALVYGLKL